MRELTSAEEVLLNTLGECASLHATLDEVHPSDREEFVRAIHIAQNIVLSRPAVSDRGIEV